MALTHKESLAYFWQQIINQFVRKEVGKGLSTNDYTTTEKTKLAATNIAYATCSTEAATAAKVITVVGNTNWELKAGSMVTVLFNYSNSASSPTFNVNGTGAKSVYYGTSQITTSNLTFAGYANRLMNFMYDGSAYRFIGWGIDNNSDTKVKQLKAITTAGEYPVILGFSTSTSEVTNSVNKTTTLKYNPNTQVLTAPTFKGYLDGLAAKATADASGNTIISTYATKTELNNAVETKVSVSVVNETLTFTI